MYFSNKTRYNTENNSFHKQLTCTCGMKYHQSKLQVLGSQLTMTEEVRIAETIWIPCDNFHFRQSRLMKVKRLLDVNRLTQHHTLCITRHRIGTTLYIRPSGYLCRTSHNKLRRFVFDFDLSSYLSWFTILLDFYNSFDFTSKTMDVRNLYLTKLIS